MQLLPAKNVHKIVQLAILLLKKIPHTKLASHMHFVLILFTTYTPGTIRLKKKVRTISKNCDNDNFIDRSLIGDTVSYKEVNV